MAFGIWHYGADSEMEDPLPMLLIFIVHAKAPFHYWHDTSSGSHIPLYQVLLEQCTINPLIKVACIGLALGICPNHWASKYHSANWHYDRNTWVFDR